MPRSDATWVFGYGSLVSPESVASTIGRPVGRTDGFVAARLHGFGRRWNYGSLRQRGDWHGPYGYVEQGIVVSLGIDRADSERCNGVIVRVTDDELAKLDRRESDYERTDVTDRVVVEDERVRAKIVTYVPRPSAVERYLVAREARRAAIRQSYVHLVEGAFRALGGHHLTEYVAGTPDPDVPVVEFR